MRNMQLLWLLQIPNKMANLSRTVSEASGSLVSDTSNPAPVEALYEMEDEAIKQIIEQMEQTNKVLSKEMDMFEKFLKRLDPKETQAKLIANVPSMQMDGRGQRKKGKQRVGSTTEKLLKLSIEQKCDIATRELDELREEMRRDREEREKILDHHKAMVTESEHRQSEISKSTYEFERDIIRGGVNPRTGKILGERVVKFFEDYIRSRDNLIEKLRLKNSTMRVRKQKLITQLKQKEESGEVRYEVDFDQLKIENQQLLEKVESKNQELLQLKVSSGKTMLVLNSYKQKVNKITSESERMKKELQGRKEMLERIHAETEHVLEEKEKAEKVHEQLKQKLEDYKVPEVIDYVKERAEHHELSKKLHVWERKLEIAEMTYRTYKQTWRQLSKQAQHLHQVQAATGHTLYTT